MISVRLFVRSAPGVCATCLRLTSVTGPGESEPTDSGVALTSTCCETGAIFSCKCKTVVRSDRTVSVHMDLLNPPETTVTVYSPIGTARNENSPAPSVAVVREKDDEAESSVTLAAAIACACGSMTVPRTSPNTEAEAFVVESTRITRQKRKRL